MHKILHFTFHILFGIITCLNGQILRFGSKLDGTGNLLMVDTVFRLETTPQVLYAKLFSKSPIIEDTLFVLIKNFQNHTTKFVMKRSTSRMDALATLKFKEDGIYKVFVINPKTKQTIVAKKIYITSAVNPNIQALKDYQQKQLALQNTNKPTPNSPKPNSNVPPKPQTIQQNHSANPNSTHKPAISSKSDMDDLDDLVDDDDLDELDISAYDADIDIKEDDIYDFDDAD